METADLPGEAAQSVLPAAVAVFGRKGSLYGFQRFPR